jgi:hypothetical protein
MKKVKINSLDDLEKIVLNPKISKLDKYRVFSEALKSFPIVFIEIITDSSDLQNGIEDERGVLIPQMTKIISELRNNPAATHYSGMSVIRNEADNEAPPDAIIDFSD